MIQSNKDILEKLDKAYKLATEARAKGYDPELTVGIPLAKNMAERVEGLISVAVPQIANCGIPKRIKELEDTYGKLDWRVALCAALEVAQEKFCSFSSQKEAIETGIRIGIAYLTLGVVASPLEGFVELDIRKRRDGKEYFALMYAGPIRSAGGTAGAVSVVLADFLRKKMGYDVYDPGEKEIKRMATELHDYHERITNLQYLPSHREIEFLVSHLPVQIDGDASENIEVSNYKDIDRIETNKIRSGPCLVLGECVAQKAVKVFAQLRKWAKDFDLLHWSFLEEFTAIQKEIKAKTKAAQKGIVPSFTYIQDLVAGRPVLGHPLATGGFRLRYGRCRNSGYSGTAIHPATMWILNKYIAIGTQLKMERPGKATTISSCDSIEGPIVKLNDESVVIVDSESKAKQVASSVKEIIFIGDLLINYGDFYNRAHMLAPSGYCEEWWLQELKKAIDEFGGAQKVSEATGISFEILGKIQSDCFNEKPDVKVSIVLSRILKIPLHPRYTYYFKTISHDEFIVLLRWFVDAKLEFVDLNLDRIILPRNEAAKRVLELLGIPHLFVNNEFVVIEKNDAEAIRAVLKLDDENFFNSFRALVSGDILDDIKTVSGILLRDKSGTFIGTRMGRPEKAKVRKLDGDPHTLFPVGKEGGKMRAFKAAFDAKFIESDFATFYCDRCQKETIFSVCETCDSRCDKVGNCALCGVVKGAKCPHGTLNAYRPQKIDINYYFKAVLKKLGMHQYPDLIKGVRGTSNRNHIPEHFAKGILRAKYDVPVNKDGTTRYDMTQAPITHFNPKEIGTQIEKLKELGYEKDIHGKDIENDEQVIELKSQDVILPKCEDAPELGADIVLTNTAKFIDELLALLYKVDTFYNVKGEKDLVGHLVVALAPHTSAGIICRIIGFSKTQGFYAHPLLHAATRRDCDGDEASVTLLMDALLNFSKQFLPNTRGATQDAPLVMTSLLNPNEVDDMAFDLDVAYEYPLEFYEAALRYEMPSTVKIKRFGNILQGDGSYSEIGFTHPTSNINNGVKCSSYKTIPSMEDKLKGQMDLADKIRAVDAVDVARLVIEKHLIRDIKGNLRKFSMQEFRCSKCTEKYRRPPLAGKCLACGSRLLFTVSEGSVVKYLEPAISLSDKYNLPAYLKQTLELTRNRVEGVFGREKDKQEGLGRWFG